MRDITKTTENPHKRPSRLPKVPYERPIRDRVIKTCLDQNRLPNEEEWSEISRETLGLAKAGYRLTSMQDEDNSVIDQLPFKKSDACICCNGSSCFGVQM